MADIVALIPARSGSKGVPDKNIKLLGGRPLMAYTIAAAHLTDTIERVIVSTDSEHYANIAREYGAEVPFLRPAEISGDSSGDYEWIRHILDWMRDNEDSQPEYLVHLRPTTPFRETTHIKAAIEYMMQSDSATALRSAHEMSQSSYKTLEVEGGYFRCICSGSFDIETANQPRQLFRETYDPNGYVDVYRTSYVIENERLLGNRVLAYITPRIDEVDTPEDFDYLEYQVARNPDFARRLFG